MRAAVPTHRLVDVVQRLSFCREDLSAVMAIVRRAVRELLAADGATFVLRDGQYCHYADEDAIAPLWKGRRFPIESCISGWVMLHGQAAVVPDIYADPRIPADAYRPTFVRSLAMVPVRTQEPIAAIGAYWATRHLASPTERQVLQAIADAAALAIANVELYRGLQSALERERAAREERERALAEAEAANRAKDEFLATVSHELRTPLTAILGWAVMLDHRYADGTTRHRALEIITRNAKTQARIIDDLLDHAQIASQHVRLNARPVALVPIIEAALHSIRPAADKKQIGVRARLDARAPVVCGDAARLQQIFSNLLSNAVKFTPSGGAVEVTLQSRPGSVEVRVRDTGDGIAAEFLPHVFDRFRQADSSMTRRHGGLGLGLAIVRRLVELHGGKVEAASPGVGQGATFTVTFPVWRDGTADPPATEAGADAQESPALDGMRVLVVDDEPDARDLMTAVLLSRRAQVAAAGSVAEALEALDRFGPDVLVADIAMPAADGYDLIRQVRTREAGSGRRVPAVALTAYARAEDRARTVAEGFDLHLAKPVEPETLTEAIRSLFRPTAR